MIRSKGEARNASDITLAAGVFLRAAVAVVLCFIVFFMLSVIFNAPKTMDNYYASVVKYDLYGAK